MICVAILHAVEKLCGFSIIVPLSKATIATIALFMAVAYWNDYFSTVLYIRSVDKWALQAVLRNMLTNTQQAMQQAGVNVMAQTNTNAQTIKAGTIVVSTVPILIVYPFVQKYFIKGVMIGSVKLIRPNAGLCYTDKHERGETHMFDDDVRARRLPPTLLPG